jgi:Fibronectin type III domain
MAKVPKLIKAVLDLHKSLPEQIVNQGQALLKGLTGNSNLPNAPIDLNAFKADLDAYAVYIAEAKDGGKKAITLRDSQGAVVIHAIRQLAAYVELNCKGDMNIFLSSGLQPRSMAPKTPQPLAQPTILGVDQGVAGQLLVSISPVRKAKSYELRFGPVGAGGATPAVWTQQMAPHARKAVAINGLTAGTTYAIQVRAYGALGFTEYSDSATRMVI